MFLDVVQSRAAGVACKINKQRCHGCWVLLVMVGDIVHEASSKSQLRKAMQPIGLKVIAL